MGMVAGMLIQNSLKVGLYKVEVKSSFPIIALGSAWW
jgi:hypothetical protein